MPAQWLSLGMTGAFINAIGILLGALFGLAMRHPLSARAQNFFKAALGVASVCLGLQLIWVGLNGTFLNCLKQLFIVMLAVVLGNWIGKLFRLQKISNRLGRYAGGIITSPKPKHNAPDNFIACTILFCAAPLGLIGAVTDGLSGCFYLLIVKAVMDGLAMTGLIRNIGWLPALSAFPVFAFLGMITYLCQSHVVPFLEPRELIYSVNAAAGLITCAVALVIFEVRKVELANYLPALAIAPWLMSLLK